MYFLMAASCTLVAISNQEINLQRVILIGMNGLIFSTKPGLNKNNVGDVRNGAFHSS